MIEGDDRTIKSDIHSLYTLEETAKKRVKSKEGDTVIKGEDSEYAEADWSIPWAVAKLGARSKEGLEEELCEYCSLDEEGRGVQSSPGSSFPVFCGESRECEEAYENYLEEAKEMNEMTLYYYEVLAIDKETEEVVVEKRVKSKDRAMAEGKAGLTTILMNYDYDRSKLAIKVTKIMDIKLLTEEW